MTGIVLALASSFSWGTGDFYGGLAARKLHQFQVLLLTTISSFTLLLVAALFRTEGLPSPGDLAISAIAGLSGALGLAALYRGLSVGHSTLVAPVAGVVGAILPTLAGMASEGLPAPQTLAGFALSIPGIWLVSQGGGRQGRSGKEGLGMAVLAGAGFGGFIALIARMEGDQVFAPLVFSKLASIGLAFLLLRMSRLPIPKPAASPIAVISGFLDAGGNILYLFATQFTRLDVAALLSSLYPAWTVLLSGRVLNERLSGGQWVGAATCITAIQLITAG